MIPFISGPLGKLTAIALAVAGAIAAFALWLHAHDNTVRAVDAARVTAATSAEQAKDAVAADAATTQAVDAERARAASLQAGTLKIEAAPDANKVVDDPAVTTALDELFGAPGAGGGQAEGAGVPVRLRPDAAPPATPAH